MKQKVLSYALVLVMLFNIFAQNGLVYAENDGKAVETLEQEKGEKDKEVENKEVESKEAENKDVENKEAEKSDGTEKQAEQTADKQDAKNEEAEDNKAEASSGPAINAETKQGKGESMFFKIPDGDDITPRVTKSRPDVYKVNEQNIINKNDYIIRDGELQKARPDIHPGDRIEFYYKWEIAPEQMIGIKAGDWFTIRLPKVEKLNLFGFDVTKPAPIESKDNPDETLGEFVVDTKTATAKLKLNQTAAKKNLIEDGFLRLRFEAKQSFDFNVDENSLDAEGIVITPKEKGETNDKWGLNPYNPSQMYKSGQTIETTVGGKKETRIRWNIYANYKSMIDQLMDRDVADKKNVWVEDDLDGTYLKIDEKQVYYLNAIYLALAEDVTSGNKIYKKGSVSTKGISWPSRRITNFIKPNPGESYEEFKTRVKSIQPAKAFTVAIYPRETGDAILFGLGDLGKNSGVSYSHIRRDEDEEFEEEVSHKLQNLLSEGKITGDQVRDTMKLYGIDGLPDTDMKKMVNYHLMFSTIPSKSGEYKNTATMTWGEESVDVTASLHYSVGAAGAGYHDVTAVSVKKNWERKEGGPVTIRLFEVTKKDDNSPEERVFKKAVKLGVKNPQNENEVSRWTYNFNNLRTHKPIKVGPNGQTKYLEIRYDVEEEMDPADQAEFEKNKAVEGTNFVFTNKNTSEATFKVTKKWLNKVPAGVDFILVDIVEKETGEVVLKDQKIEKPANASTDWEKTFTVPKYNLNKNLATYKVVEKTTVPGYISVAQGDNVIYNVETTNISATKVWKDDSNKLKNRPASITFVLTGKAEGDDQPVVEEKTLNATNAAGDSNTWRVTFENLPKYSTKSGKPYVYTIKEKEAVTGYRTSKASGDAETGFEITNTRTGKTKVIVTKTWVGKPANSVVIELLQNGASMNPKKIIELKKETQSGLNWQGTFEDLEKFDENGDPYIYTVVERNVDKLRYQVAAPTGDQDQGYGITNTNIEKVEISVAKKWNAPSGKIPESIDIVLTGDNGYNQKVTLKAPWVHTFSNLPRYKADGTEITYKIREVIPTGFSSKPAFTGVVTDENKVVLAEENTPQNSVTARGNVTITNTVVGKVSVGITKQWLGAVTADNITVGVFRKGESNPVKTAVITGEKTLNALWSYTFDELEQYDNSGREVVYEVKELKIDSEDVIYQAGKDFGTAKGYKVTTKGNLIQNYNTERIDIPVLKTWVGDITVFEVIVRLYADGTEVEHLVLKAENGWRGEFKNKPRFHEENGKEIVYTLTEDEVIRYQKDITGNAQVGFTVTNTYIPPYEPYNPPGGDTPPTPNTPPTTPPTPNTPNTPPTPPTTDIPETPVPQGEPTPPTATLPTTPETPIEDNIIPKGKTELPKTDGISAGMLYLMGLALAGLGGVLKRKRK